MSRPSLGRGMVPSVGMDPGEHCTWGFCRGPDIIRGDRGKVWWLKAKWSVCVRDYVCLLVMSC